MKTFQFKTLTKLKEEIQDPKGLVVEDIAKKLNIISKAKIKVGKFYHISFEANSKKEALEKAEILAQKILTNPIIETFEIRED